MLFYRIYEDLKVRLAVDVRSRAKADITTKPSLQPEELSVEGELEEGITYSINRTVDW